MAHIQTAKAETMLRRMPAKRALTTAATGMPSREDVVGRVMGVVEVLVFRGRSGVVDEVMASRDSWGGDALRLDNSGS